MQTKPLLYGLIGFFLGGLLVSTAATTFDKPQAASHADGVSMSQMTADLETKTGDDYDRAFIEYMIDHHQAAVDMAKLSALNAKHDEIKDLSAAIITAQEQEINDLRKWQVEWHYKNVADKQLSH